MRKDREQKLLREDKAKRKIAPIVAVRKPPVVYKEISTEEAQDLSIPFSELYERSGRSTKRTTPAKY